MRIRIQKFNFELKLHKSVVMDTYKATMDVLAAQHDDNDALYHKAIVASDVQSRWLLNSALLYKAALMAGCEEARNKLIIESKKCYDLAHTDDNGVEDWGDLQTRDAVEGILPDDEVEFDDLLKEIVACDERHS